MSKTFYETVFQSFLFYFIKHFWQCAEFLYNRYSIFLFESHSKKKLEYEMFACLFNYKNKIFISVIFWFKSFKVLSRNNIVIFFSNVAEEILKEELRKRKNNSIHWKNILYFYEMKYFTFFLISMQRLKYE